MKNIAFAFLVLALTTWNADARNHHHNARRIAATFAGQAVVLDDPTDNADNTAYDDGWQNTDNGGSGYNAWTTLENTGGNQFLTTTRQVDGARSFEIFTTSTGTYAEGRPIASSISLGLYTVTARFDVSNAVAFSGFNVKSAAGASFGANELLSFGLTPGSGNNGIFVGGSVNQTLDLGHDIRGNVIQFSLSFNTTAGSFSLTATDTSNPSSNTVTGSLKSSGSPVAVLGFGNFNTDAAGNQNFIFDSPTINAVPEPSTLALLTAPAFFGAFFFARRRRA